MEGYNFARHPYLSTTNQRQQQVLSWQEKLASMARKNEEHG
jgi:hypothetical protein